MRPVLEVLRLRVDVEGIPEVDGLSFATTGDRVLVLAAAPALFKAAAGLVAPRHGELFVGGVAPTAAIRARTVASAPLDSPLPASWKVLEYVTWSSRLAGHPKRAAAGLAVGALAKLKLEGLSDVRLRHVPLHAQRAVAVAAALATGSTTLLLEDPLRALPEDAARSLGRVLVRATEGLRMVVFAARASLASPLSIDADEAVVLDGSTVVLQGAPAEVAARDRSYALRLHGRGASFAELAETRGARVSGHGASWTVDLGASTLQPSDLLDVAAASDTVVLELRPLTHAFT